MMAGVQLPMPIDPKDKLLALAVQSSGLIQALDQEILRVKGLSNQAQHFLRKLLAAKGLMKLHAGKAKAENEMLV